MKKTINVVLLASTVALASIGTAQAAVKQNDPVKLHMTKAPQHMSVLFVQVAQSGTLTADTLTLNNVSAKTIWFSDRPVRKAGWVSTDNFVKRWTQKMSGINFKSDHPNAAIVDAKFSSDKLVIMAPSVLELSAPTYNAANHTLTYHVKFISSKVVVKQPIMFKDVGLFIDSDPCAQGSYCADGLEYNWQVQMPSFDEYSNYGDVATL